MDDKIISIQPEIENINNDKHISINARTSPTDLTNHSESYKNNGSLSIFADSKKNCIKNDSTTSLNKYISSKITNLKKTTPIKNKINTTNSNTNLNSHRDVVGLVNLHNNSKNPLCTENTDSLINSQTLVLESLLKSKTNKWSPTTKLYAWKVYDTDFICYAVLNIHKHGKPYIFIQTDYENENNEKGELVVNLLFNDIKKLVDECEDIGIVCSNMFMKFLRKVFITQSSFKNIYLDEPVAFFYINDENYKKYIKNGPSIEEGFEIIQLPPSYAQTMMDQLLFFGKGDLELATNRLEQYPSVGIIEKSTNKIASFYYNDGYGFLAHQFTFKDYRKRGFGTACEIELSRLNKEMMGVIPMKAVSLSRKYVLQLTEKLKYWSRISNKDFSQPDVYWTFFSKNEKHKTEIFDN
ncbi:Acyl-CoA N-acyltransferase domain-containing protein [Strongyloides ratti]|uniref:Glycine N-acyltransferase-like protein n=1 Tax=Strongyloides ratti TaxID=34506 RepID=A0A090LBU2_STRRB|nr:Acyl-CoA N-acyltransferase domain-containing protein [Strongyloides ratti]CEF65015.1 Acyl-CoA N-acyltransferase domain-containing protein [Strongyloides ratti]